MKPTNIVTLSFFCYFYFLVGQCQIMAQLRVGLRQSEVECGPIQLMGFKASQSKHNTDASKGHVRGPAHATVRKILLGKRSDKLMLRPLIKSIGNKLN